MAGLPPLQSFRDVPLVPVRSVTQHIADGGPIWPEFDQQIAARHCRDGQPVDRCPKPRRKPVRLEGPAIWGGFLNPQFGHLVVEQLTRLPQALRERPDDHVLFSLPPSSSAALLPPWLWQVVEWHGVPRVRVRLVDRALIAPTLRVAAQGEMMGTQVTSSEYLDLLDRNTARQALEPAPASVVFVTRAGMVALGQGGHAGEGYLADALRRAGVRVVDPAQHRVRQQLSIYAGANTLVFSEGSALHGRLLLGRLRQNIHVLRRRPHRDLAAEQLTPRCDTLTYHAAVRNRLGARMGNGTHRLDLTAALYDLKIVFDLFSHLGHDLRPFWDETAYRAAVVADLLGWLANCKTDPDQLIANIELLQQAGLAITFPLPLPLPPRASAAGLPLHP